MTIVTPISDARLLAVEKAERAVWSIAFNQAVIGPTRKLNAKYNDIEEKIITAAWGERSFSSKYLVQGIEKDKVLPMTATTNAVTKLKAIAVSNVRRTVSRSFEPDANEARVADASDTPSSSIAKNKGTLVRTSHSPYCRTPQAPMKKGTTKI